MEVNKIYLLLIRLKAFHIDLIPYSYRIYGIYIDNTQNQKNNEIDSSVKKDDWIQENWKDEKKKQKTVINRKHKRSKK